MSVDLVTFMSSYGYSYIKQCVYRSSASTICTTIPVAAPPPLQIAATPYSPFFNWCNRVTMILEPELPSAWPRAMAPPRGLTFEASRLRICVMFR